MIRGTKLLNMTKCANIMNDSLLVGSVCYISQSNLHRSEQFVLATCCYDDTEVRYLYSFKRFIVCFRSIYISNLRISRTCQLLVHDSRNDCYQQIVVSQYRYYYHLTEMIHFISLLSVCVVFWYCCIPCALLRAQPSL